MSPDTLSGPELENITARVQKRILEVRIGTHAAVLKKLDFMSKEKVRSGWKSTKFTRSVSGSFPN